MSRPNILVTGASGFIGRNFMKKISHKRCNVFALDKREDQRLLDLPFKRFIQQDLAIPFKLVEQFDFIFHFAALNVTHVDKAQREAYHLANVRGTQNLIEGVHAQKFVFLSTAKVYKHNVERIDEEVVIDPHDDYARSKFAAEEICRSRWHPNHLIILRPVNIVGGGQADKAVLPVFFKRAIQNQPLEVFVPRRTVLQLLSIDDLVRLLDSLLFGHFAPGVFNVAPADYVTVEDLALRIIQLTQSKSEIKFLNSDEATFTTVTAQKAKDLLGWDPVKNIRDILSEYYEYLRNG